MAFNLFGMKLLFTLLFVLSYWSANSQNRSSPPTFNELFVPVDTVYIDINNDTFLTTPVNLCFNGNYLVWGAENSITIFSKNRSLLYYQDKKGRGPGEFERAVHYSCNGNSISVLDRSSNKVSLFRYSKNGKELLFSDEFSISKKRPSKLLDVGHSLFTLNNLLNPNVSEPAISVYKKDGTTVTSVGLIPKSAELQSFIEGSGGITVDDSSNIYYSFLGDHRVWKWSQKKDSVIIFDNKPEYFINTESGNLKKASKSSMEKIRYAFEISRITDLFFLSPDLIIQQIEPDNYLKEGAKQKVLIEVFDTNGIKKYSSVQLPNVISFTYKDLIYIPVDFFSNLISGQGKKAVLIRYKFKVK